MVSFESFGLRQMIESTVALRHLGQTSESMEEAAGEVVDYLFNAFHLPGATDPACALVRCFKTHRFGELPVPLREAAASAMHGASPGEAMPCLILLATRGIKPEWNTRHASAGHKAIPLATTEMVAQAPMIARLVQQLGLDTCDIVGSTPETLMALERRTLNVFHVQEALGSEFVPAQTGFVQPFSIKSVLGLGGVLPTGELFFIVLFTRATVSPETAELFRNLALGIKLVFLRYPGERVFAAEKLSLSPM